MAMMPTARITAAKPRALIGTPMYLRPLSNTVAVMMRRSVMPLDLEERSEPTMTIGTEPMMIEDVNEKSTWLKSNVPSVAESVRGTDWARSVPTK
jgi:hypothetical protein